jgi:L-methionine (R)-S-oxide reductase
VSIAAHAAAHGAVIDNSTGLRSARARAKASAFQSLHATRTPALSGSIKAGDYNEGLMTERHEQALRAVREALQNEADAQRAMDAAVTLLARHLPDYTWTGIYVLDGNELCLGPYVGKPSPHTRIPLGRGICGAAATEKATIIVDDVNADPRYLACSIETRSEIVVPIMLDGEVLGELDIDSDRPAAFGEADRALLEQIAALLAPTLAAARAAREA